MSGKAIGTSAALLFAGAILAAGGVSAQEAVHARGSEGVLLPSPSLTESDDATALSVNPANLGFLDSWSFVYAGSWLSDQRHRAGQGHGLFLAVPLGPFGLAISTEFMTPPDAIREWQGLDDRMRFSIGASFNPIRAMGFGFAYRTFFYYQLGDIDTFDFALTVRPVNYLSLAFVLSDANAPEAAYAATVSRDGERIPSRLEDLPRRFAVGLTVRPLGTDRLAIGGEMAYLYGQSKIYDQALGTFGTADLRRTDASALLTVMIVDGLSLRTRFGAEGLRDSGQENGYFLDASLTIDSRRFPFGVQAGSSFKLAPGEDRGFEAVNWAVRFSGDEPPTLPFHLPPARAALFRLEKPADSYEHARLMRLFERVTADRGVDIVVLQPDADTISLTEALEYRRRLKEMRREGRKTVCYLTEATGPVYLACAGADQVWINPAGGVRLTGLKTHAVFFKSLLDKVGVEADIVRIGEYKSAPEAFTGKEPTDPSAEAMNRMMDTIYARVAANLEADRGLRDPDAARKIMDDGPYTASEALAARLVDRLIPADRLEEELKTLADGPVIVSDSYGDEKVRHRAYLDSPAVAVLHIEGDIIDGESVHIPILDIRMTGAKTMTEELRRLAEDPNIHAVVLRIDSPGGSALASDLIWREVMALREKKPVVASLGAVAASGAYYVASAANVIYAEHTTMTGSIGIYYGKADVSGLLGKIGVDVTTYKRGSHADMESWTRPYTPEERRKLLGQIREFYNLFLDRVVEGRGRGFTREIADKRGRGRIWSGSDAKRHLLVDEIGGYLDALNHARSLGNVSVGTRVFQVPKQRTGLLMRVAKLLRAAVRDNPGAMETLLDATDIKRTLRAVMPFAVADDAAPQARLPYAVMED